MLLWSWTSSASASLIAVLEIAVRELMGIVINGAIKRSIGSKVADLHFLAVETAWVMSCSWRELRILHGGTSELRVWLSAFAMATYGKSSI